MIKNLIFDMGGVLIQFDPVLFVSQCVQDENDRQLLLRQVFRTKEWVQMDRGVLTEEEAVPMLCARLPERLHAAAEHLICHWDEPILPIPGMAALLQEAKDAGLKLYLLSNASYRQAEYWPRVPGSALFDGRFVSAEWRMLKPSTEIFRTMLLRYGLEPTECLFIDDAPQNIEGAGVAGIDGIVFHGDAELLRAELKQRGILP